MSVTDPATPPENTAPDQDIESYLDTGKPRKWYRRKRFWAILAVVVLLLFVGNLIMAADTIAFTGARLMPVSGPVIEDGVLDLVKLEDDQHELWISD